MGPRRPTGSAVPVTRARSPLALAETTTPERRSLQSPAPPLGELHAGNCVPVPLCSHQCRGVRDSHSQRAPRQRGPKGRPALAGGRRPPPFPSRFRPPRGDRTSGAAWAAMAAREGVLRAWPLPWRRVNGARAVAGAAEERNRARPRQRREPGCGLPRHCERPWPTHCCPQRLLWFSAGSVLLYSLSINRPLSSFQSRDCQSNWGPAEGTSCILSI
ncbi:uncharacterized protein LOC134557628 [Prinia subflava]|uniref:uncharacterized protein LOC134557628 n=1 Tax=Prinia subflava TaxID=208062 RepID=UPI002FE313F3